jgi:hypothetical protein
MQMEISSMCEMAGDVLWVLHVGLITDDI